MTRATEDDRSHAIYKLKSSTERVWDIGTRLLIPLSIAAAAAIINHELRLAKIEETRFTALDGAHLRSDTASKYDVGKLELLLNTIDERTRSIEKAMIRFETHTHSK